MLRLRSRQWRTAADLVRRRIIARGGGTERVWACIYLYILYDTHTNWWTGEKRADKAGVKSEGGCTCNNEGGCTCNNDTVFDFPRTPWRSIRVHGCVV